MWRAVDAHIGGPEAQIGALEGPITLTKSLIRIRIKVKKSLIQIRIRFKILKLDPHSRILKFQVKSTVLTYI